MRSGPRGRARRSGSSRRWARSTPVTARSSRPRGRSAISSSRASSSTRRSSRSRATWTPTRPISRPISRGPRRPASTSSSPPRAEEFYPPGFATWVEPEGAAAGLEGEARPGPLSRRRDRLPEAVHDRPARHRLLRPQGRAAGRGRQAARPRPEPRARDPGRPHRPRRRRPRSLVSQRPPLSGGAPPGARDPARPRNPRPGQRPPASSTRPASSPTTSPWPTSTGRRSPSRRVSARPA